MRKERRLGFDGGGGHVAGGRNGVLRGVGRQAPMNWACCWPASTGCSVLLLLKPLHNVRLERIAEKSARSRSRIRLRAASPAQGGSAAWAAHCECG